LVEAVTGEPRGFFAQRPVFLRGYGSAVAFLAQCTVLSLPHGTAFVIALPVAVLAITVRFGIGRGVFAAARGALVFDFFFVPPAFDFDVPGFKDAAPGRCVAYAMIPSGMRERGVNAAPEARLPRAFRGSSRSGAVDPSGSDGGPRPVRGTEGATHRRRRGGARDRLRWSAESPSEDRTVPFRRSRERETSVARSHDPPNGTVVDVDRYPGRWIARSHDPLNGTVLDIDRYPDRWIARSHDPLNGTVLDIDRYPPKVRRGVPSDAKGTAIGEEGDSDRRGWG
jgi:hypothetical protein